MTVIETGNAELGGLKDLRDPLAAAAAIGAANEALGRSREVSDRARGVVHEITKALAETDLRLLENLSPVSHAILLKGLAEATTAVDERDRARLRIALTRLEHALRGVADRVAAQAGDPRAALAWLLESTRVPKAQIASLIGANERAVQRWTADGATGGQINEYGPQIELLAEAVSELRHMFTPAGAVEWFNWPRDDLDERAPRELLPSPQEFPVLRRAIARTRSGDAA